MRIRKKISGIISNYYEVVQRIDILALMTKKEIEQENEQIRKQVQQQLIEIEQADREQEALKEKIRILYKKLENNYAKYMNL